MVNLIEFDAGATVPAHSHPHEQLGIVLRGMQALVVDGVARELGPMEGYVLPGKIEHSAYCGPDGATVIDVFCPVREDYREKWEGSSPQTHSRGARRATASGRFRARSTSRATSSRRTPPTPSAGADVRRPRRRHRPAHVRRGRARRPTGGRRSCALAVSRPATGVLVLIGKTPSGMPSCSERSRPACVTVPCSEMLRARDLDFRREHSGARSSWSTETAPASCRRSRGPDVIVSTRWPWTRRGLRRRSARRTTRRRRISRSSSTRRGRRRTRRGARTPTATPGRSACRPSTGSMSTRATSSGARPGPAGRSRSGTCLLGPWSRGAEIVIHGGWLRRRATLRPPPAARRHGAVPGSDGVSADGQAAVDERRADLRHGSGEPWSGAATARSRGGQAFSRRMAWPCPTGYGRRRRTRCSRARARSRSGLARLVVGRRRGRRRRRDTTA